MGKHVVILDCYTVEPSGLGVPPYLSTYVRTAYAALDRAWPEAEVRYVTIDDVRWCLADGRPGVEPPLSDPLTYSATVNREDAIRLLRDAEAVVVVAGDKVPSVHLHAVNGTVDEIARALACVRGRRYLLGPMATYALAEPATYRAVRRGTHAHGDLGGSRAGQSIGGGIRPVAGGSRRSSCTGAARASGSAASATSR
jgi:radical SAM superfamily enzyme with C-terminal helix-hairpin-helix motif